MLQLLSSILAWTDEQREQVGLQRSSGLSAPSVIASGSRPARGHARSGKGKSVGDSLGENEVSTSGSETLETTDALLCADLLKSVDRVPAKGIVTKQQFVFPSSLDFFELTLADSSSHVPFSDEPRRPLSRRRHSVQPPRPLSHVPPRPSPLYSKTVVLRPRKWLGSVFDTTTARRQSLGWGEGLAGLV